jgi:hypothetical protein
LESSQLLGYVDRERLLCSSLGIYGPPIPLGPQRYRNILGLEVRPALHLPQTPAHIRAIDVRNGTALVLATRADHRFVYPNMRDISVGVTTSTGVPIAGRRHSLRSNANDRLPRVSLVGIEDGDGLVECRDLADVRP